MEETTLFEFSIPKEIKEINLPDPADYNYWQARKGRTFYIDYEIERDYCLLELSKTIIHYNMLEKDIPKEQLEPIYIWVHSYGGDIEQAMYFCDLIKASRIPIITIGMGVCLSAGFLILLSGHRRYAFPHTQMLVHSGSADFSGTAEQIEEAQKNYKKQIEAMKEYILNNTSIDEKTFNKNKSKDWYLTSEEIKKYNVCSVVNSFEEII